VFSLRHRGVDVDAVKELSHLVPIGVGGQLHVDRAALDEVGHVTGGIVEASHLPPSR